MLVPSKYYSLMEYLFLRRKFLDEQTIMNTRKLVQNSMAEILVDFDNHLDDIQLDWTNPKINRALPNGTLQ